MGEIKFRIAKPSDAKQIANLQWQVRERYTQGISLSLGKEFLKEYYKIILNDPWEVIVCAVNEDNNIIGFTSTSINAEERFKNLKKHKFKLGLAVLFSIIKKPYLLKEIWIRYKSLSNKDTKQQFINIKGPRGGYWCWSKKDDSMKSFELTKIKNQILKSLGLNEFYFEVDKSNKAVYKFHLKINKAQIIDEIILPDGRERVLMKKTLE